MRDTKMIAAAVMLASGLFLAQGAEAQTSAGGTVPGQLQEGLLTKVMLGTNQAGMNTVTVEIDNNNYTLWMPSSGEYEILGEEGDKRTAQELGSSVMVVRYRLRSTNLGLMIDRIECPCPKK